MLHLSRSSQFKRDVKRVIKREKKPAILKRVICLLLENKPLPQKMREHKLAGNYRGRLECHLEPDWLLIYKKTASELILERTGSHSDLFS